MDHVVIRQLRREVGLTQFEVASVLGVNKQTVHRWEIGMHRMPKDKEFDFVHLVTNDFMVKDIKAHRPTWVRGVPFKKRGSDE